mmetsp:Transcript_9387/g.25522  ORF Transcript_9387/g.25522 Transcript_9387/m.25522 type:complete len:240 (-) Transcript_9387:1173-1892(-)
MVTGHRRRLGERCCDRLQAGGRRASEPVAFYPAEGRRVRDCPGGRLARVPRDGSEVGRRLPQSGCIPTGRSLHRASLRRADPRRLPFRGPHEDRPGQRRGRHRWSEALEWPGRDRRPRVERRDQARPHLRGPGHAAVLRRRPGRRAAHGGGRHAEDLPRRPQRGEADDRGLAQGPRAVTADRRHHRPPLLVHELPFGEAFVHGHTPLGLHEHHRRAQLHPQQPPAREADCPHLAGRDPL